MEYSKDKYEGIALNKAYAFGFLYTKEIFYLQCLLWDIKLENPIVVNIGAGVGTSTLSFREANPGADIYTIDISKGSPNGGLENEKNAFAEADLKLPTQILGDSKEVVKTFNKKIDLLFIDGDHSYNSCYKDCEDWFSKVNNNGIIAIHDYCSIMWGEVKNAVDNFFSLKKVEKLLHIDTIIAFRKISD